jgi:hypothetical protein
VKRFTRKVQELRLECNWRQPLALYVDEFQNLAAQSFETVLTGARKFGLCLTTTGAGATSSGASRRARDSRVLLRPSLSALLSSFHSRHRRGSATGLAAFL